MAMENGPKIKADILRRVQWLYLIFTILGSIIVLRLVWIQFFSNEISTNATKIHGRIFQSQTIIAHRGSILSRDGEPLATSIMRYQVEMDFGSEGFDSLELFTRHTDSLSRLLSAYFGDRTTAQYKAFFKEYRDKYNRREYIKDTLVRRPGGWILRFADMIRGESMMSVKLYDTIRIHRPVPLFPREIDYAEWQELRRYPVLNWNLGMTYQLVGRESRVYAQGNMARRTIGALNEDRGDDYGLEAVYDDVLRGEDGEHIRQRIARGFYGRVAGGEIREAVDGLDIVTTIDVGLQDVADRLLREQLTRNNSLWGTTIVMEVESGDILALVNLDRMGDGSYREVRNHAFGARTEPGSTLKLASTMALLEVAKMPTSQIYDSGDGERVRVGSAWVRDSHKGYSEVELRTAFAQSLNVYFAKAVYEYFKDDGSQYTGFLKSLKLDQPVGFEKFGELTPRLPSPSESGWYPHVTLPNMGYGYGLEVSPIEVITLYNGVANNGRMMEPRLVSEVQREGRTVERFKPEVRVEQMCSKPTLDTLHSYLREVCASGTGAWYLGRFNGFEVSAKTGTAQYAQDGLAYSDGYYIGTVVSYIPSDNPRYTVLTTVHTRLGRGGSVYGAFLSGPVVQGMMQHLYNIHPQWHARLDTISRGDVTRPERKQGGLEHIESLEVAEGVVPNLYGYGLRDAVYMLESLGFRVKISGSGAVWRQSIRGGTKVSAGSEVMIYLR
ncbi:MAG: penicillin-binding transpeptidase domain-containing protein [Rikenellaceae bacterium]